MAKKILTVLFFIAVVVLLVVYAQKSTGRTCGR
jgi:hypothetical protein